MRKATTAKRQENLGFSKPTSKTTGSSQNCKVPIKDKKPILKPSVSENNLLDNSSRGTPLRKASTPTHEKTALSLSPDISQILSTSRNIKQTKPAANPIQEANNKKTGVMKDQDFQDQLIIEYSKYLQAAFKKKYVKSKASDIEENIASLQKRIADNQRILELTTKRLEAVNFHTEVDLLYKLNNPNFGKILETLDNSNYEECLLTLERKLEQSQNQLRVKNVDVPKNGGDGLLSVINDTVAALDKLKCDHNVEAARLLDEMKGTNRNNTNLLSKCKDQLSATEELLYTKATLELCNHQET